MYEIQLLNIMKSLCSLQENAYGLSNENADALSTTNRIPCKTKQPDQLAIPRPAKSTHAHMNDK